MAMITLISESQAVVGREFYFIGPLTECKECRLKGVCFNLEPGARYRVAEVRGQRHECQENEDFVVAVEVEKVPTPAAVPKKGAMEGVTITYAEPKCSEVGCPNYLRCHAPGKREGLKYTVTRLGKDLDCPVGEKMVNADLL